MRHSTTAFANPLLAVHEQGEDSRKTCSVLLVEDEVGIAQFVVETLRETGYAVSHVRDGEAAIRALSPPQSDAFCIVLLDMMLPRVDGLAVLKHLTRYGLQLPVVALSASSEQLRAARSAGARELLAKPFELDHLLAAVARYCGEPRL